MVRRMVRCTVAVGAVGENGRYYGNFVHIVTGLTIRVRPISARLFRNYATSTMPLRRPVRAPAGKRFYLRNMDHACGLETGGGVCRPFRVRARFR